MKTALIWSILFAASALSAQHIGYLIPSGGKAGETVEVLLGGQQLWGIREGIVTGKGVTVESVTLVPGIPPVGGKQRTFLVDWMRDVAKGKKGVPLKPSDPEELKDWRKHPYFDKIDTLTPLELHILTESIFVPRNSLQMSPAINSLAILKIKIAPDAPPGCREFRLLGNTKLSNPLPFYVGTIPEEKEPYMAIPPKNQEVIRFRIPSVLNGQILPKETDTWCFSAKKGQKLIFQTEARSLVPFMGDCVPGYFQCSLEVLNAKGKRIGYADDNYFDPDPVLSCVIPEDGEYRLLVRDAIYRGRADFVYRISVTEGEASQYKLLNPPPMGLPLTESEKLPVSRETSFPVLLKGRIAEPGASELFRIKAVKGEKIVGEVFARRLLSPLDSYLTVSGPDGKQIAVNDDFPRIKVGTLLQHTDSFLSFTAPENGEYTFRVTDNTGKGGKDYGYYLRIDHERPDFNIYCVPSSLSVEIFGVTPVEVIVEPLEGFNDEIRLDLKATNRFYFVGNPVIPAGCTRAFVTMSCAQDRNRGIVPAEITAVSGKVRRKVIPADEVTQAFAYTHLMPSENLYLLKRWSQFGSNLFSWANPRQLCWKLSPGGTLQLKILRKELPKGAEYEFKLRNEVKGLTLAKVETAEKEKGTAEITLTLQADGNIKEQKFNQIVTVGLSYNAPPNKEGKVSSRKSEIALPAVQLDIGGK